MTNEMCRRVGGCLLLVLLLAAPAATAVAQSAAGSTNDWELALTPFLWGSGIDGTVGITGREQDVEASVEQILEALDFGVMANVEARNDRWVLGFDVVYTNFGKDVTLGAAVGTPEPGMLDMSMTIVEGDFGYRLSEVVDVFAGLRGVSVPVTLTTESGRSESADGGFVDPIVGARYRRSIGQRTWVNLRGDIGGFSVGSDFSWYLAAVLGFRVTRSVSLDVGYRAWGFDYESDGGLKKLDLTLAGFAFGATFEF